MSNASSSPRADLAAALRGVLLDPAEASALDVQGRTDAAVLVPLFIAGGDVHAVFTKRRDDLRRHAGEISFPGGREDDTDRDLTHTALREAHEEIGLEPDAVEIVGALQPTPTIATGYSVYPFVGLIEHTNLIGSERYGGSHLLYVANYVAPGHELLRLGPEELLERYLPGLRRVNAEFAPDWVRRLWVFREPAAQPIVTLGYQERIPPMRTPAHGLMLANTTQIYPEDRGTNYSVRLGERAAAELADLG